jgi:hypothetical protein
MLHLTLAELKCCFKTAWRFVIDCHPPLEAVRFWHSVRWFGEETWELNSKFYQEQKQVHASGRLESALNFFHHCPGAAGLRERLLRHVGTTMRQPGVRLFWRSQTVSKNLFANSN